LTDDNFATIVASVEEGRSIFENIASFIRYLLSSTVGEILTMFFGVVFATVIGLEAGENGIIVPLVATQILWINLLTDTGPALALGTDPVDPLVMERGPRGPGDRLIDRDMMATIGLIGFTMAVATLAMLDFKLPGGLVEGSSDLDTARTAAFTVLVLAQLFNAFNTRSKRRSAFYRPFSNPWLLAAIAGSFALQLLVVHTSALNDAFSTAPLSLNDWLLSALLASSVLWVGELHKLVRRIR
jgi:Ca2+-transporting ATPase